MEEEARRSRRRSTGPFDGKSPSEVECASLRAPDQRLHTSTRETPAPGRLSGRARRRRLDRRPAGAQGALPEPRSPERRGGRRPAHAGAVHPIARPAALLGNPVGRARGGERDGGGPRRRLDRPRRGSPPVRQAGRPGLPERPPARPVDPLVPVGRCPVHVGRRSLRRPPRGGRPDRHGRRRGRGEPRDRGRGRIGPLRIARVGRHLRDAGRGRAGRPGRPAIRPSAAPGRDRPVSGGSLPLLP